MKRIRRKPLKEVLPTEEQEQIKLAVWLKNSGIRFYAIPNGGYRNLFEAVKIKRMGASKGIPDICIPIASGPYHGLYIELKRSQGGVTSGEQLEWINYLQLNGYYAEVANGFEAAKKIVDHYLSLSPKAA